MAINRPVSHTVISTTQWGIPITDEVNRIAGLVDGNMPTAWVAVTFLNGWANVGGVMRTARYRKIGDVAYVEGTIKGSTTASPAFNLPVGYRPLQQIQFPTYSAGSVGGGALTTGGDFYIQFGDLTAVGLALQFSIS